MGRPKKKLTIVDEVSENEVNESSEPKNSELLNTLHEINKKCGLNVLHFASDEKDWEKVAFDVEPLDKALGGGIPRGKFSVVWGPSQSGKTTLCYKMIAKAQKQGLRVCFMALEGFDAERAVLFGVDLKTLILARFPKAEQALDTIIKLSKEKLVDVIIVDSIHSMAPKGELEEGKNKEQKSTEADTMALLARKLSQFFRMAIDPVYRGNVAVLLIGQTRTNVGFIAFEQLSGGNALKHSAKLIINLRRGQKADAPTEKYKDENGKTQHKIVGFDTCLKLEKVQVPNCSVEGTEIHIPYHFNRGFVWE